MNLTEVLVKHRNLAGLGEHAGGQSKCKPLCWVLKGGIKVREKQILPSDLPPHVSGGRRDWRGCILDSGQGGVFRNRDWESEPAGQACEV